MGIKQITQTDVDTHNDYKKTKEADVEVEFDSTLKAFALVMLDEINLLRDEVQKLKGDTSLPERTVSQLKGAVKAKL